MIFIVPVNFLVDDTCNPLPGFIPTYKTVGYEQSAGCRLYPEVYLRGSMCSHADIFWLNGVSIKLELCSWTYLCYVS